MKNLILVLVVLLPVSAFACPDLSGSYVDNSGESVVLSQKGCEQVTVNSTPLSITLVLDNQFVVVQDDIDALAMGRGTFEADEMVIEVKVTYKRDPGIPTVFLPVRGINKYSELPTGDLLEKSTIFNARNSVLTSTKTIYKKVNP